MDKAPFPPTDYTKFRPFAEVLQESAGTLQDKNITAKRIVNNRESFELIERKTGRLGFRRISDNVRSGGYALVFEGNNHQMLRIVSAKALEQTRPSDWSVLQPLMSMKCGSADNEFTIEVLPKVHTLDEIIKDKELSLEYNLTNSDVWRITEQLCVYHLRKYNRVFDDFGPQNIGIIRSREGNNVPVIVDPDTIVGRKNFHTDLPQPSEPMPESCFREAQEYHLQCLGLECGKANRVISEGDLEEFYARRKSMVGSLDDKTDIVYEPEESIYWRMANNDGLYPHEIGTIMKAAAAKFPKPAAGDLPREKGFCHEVEAARRNYQKSLQ